MKDPQVISFAEKFFEHRGKELGDPALPEDHQNERVDPEKDLVAKLAIEIITVVGKNLLERPITTMAALQLVGTTFGIELIRKYGQEQASKIANTALARSRKYAPVFKD